MKAGILVIGSLWWSDNKVRKRWRDERLRIEDAIPVFAPIRYGRLSRNQTYTMVFSRAYADPPRLGRALVVPCRYAMDSIDALLHEARRLWAAEDKGASSTTITAAAWGAVAVLFRPGSGAEARLGDTWRTHFRQECSRREFNPRSTDDGSGAIVTPGGRLDIAWPQPLDPSRPCDFDLLLATTNIPAPLPVPGDQHPTAVADAWIVRTDADYFFSNVRADIRTADDAAVWQRLRQVDRIRTLAPAEAVDILESDLAVTWVRAHADKRLVRVTQHAQEEMADEEVLLDDLLTALGAPELLENYPDHRRGACGLFLGFSQTRRPLHVVCTTEGEMLVIITVYEPRRPKWVDARTRGAEHAL